MLVESEIYTNVLVKHANKVRKDKKVISDIKKELQKYGMLQGDIQRFFEEPKEYLKDNSFDENMAKYLLIGEQIYLKTGDTDFRTENFFTVPEIKKARQFSDKSNRSKTIDLPYTFENVIYLGNGSWIISFSAKEIKKFMDSRLIDYNFDIQRESTDVKVGGVFRKRPTINKVNVREMREHLQKETLKHSMIILNAAIGTSDDGEEVVYDDTNNKIIITKGTRLDVVDGFHRLLSVQQALSVAPDINFNFPVLITNESDDEVRQHQAQHAKMTPISVDRQRSLEGKSYADIVVKNLMNKSDLKNRIEEKNRVQSSAGKLVKYSTLVDAIGENFKMEAKIDAHEVSKYLIDFFDFLLGSYKEVFMDNTSKTRKNNLMAHNNMFIGYVIIAAKMRNEDIPASKVKEYVDKINFSRENPLWKEIGLLNEKGNIDLRTKQKITNYFNTLDIKGDK